MRCVRSGVLLALVVVLSGCSSAPPTSYDLNAATPAIARAPRATFRIRMPTATADLFNQRILVRTGENALAVLKGGQWSDQLPPLVRARLTATFQNVPGLRAIGDDAAVTYDYDVQSDIRDFEVDTSSRQVVIDIAVKVVAASSGRVVAARDFKANAPVPSTAPEVVAAALDHALSGVMVDIVSFVIASR
jgi:cholesterol transport system auxiliary component